VTSRPTASIIILTYNNLKYTRLCLESIFAKTEAPDFEVILVDNASTDDTPAYLQSFAAQKNNVKLILNPENTGFPHGNNQGAAIAQGQYLVLLNNDTVVTEGWLSGLIRHLQDPTVGMVGPVTNSSGNETRIAVDYQQLEEMPAFARAYAQAHQSQSFEISMLPFHCVALRREIFDQTGLIDERFSLGMFEDDDYAIRLQKQGLKLLCAEDVFIHHWGSASFSALGETEYRRLFEENRQKFEHKWGCPWQPHLYRRELQRQQIGEMIQAAARREEEISAQDMLISQRDQAIAQQGQIIELRNQMVAERDQTITWSSASTNSCSILAIWNGTCNLPKPH
jgi:GT2 family glycosyltransferase